MEAGLYRLVLLLYFTLGYDYNNPNDISTQPFHRGREYEKINGSRTRSRAGQSGADDFTISISCTYLR